MAYSEPTPPSPDVALELVPPVTREAVALYAANEPRIAKAEAAFAVDNLTEPVDLLVGGMSGNYSTTATIAPDHPTAANAFAQLKQLFCLFDDRCRTHSLRKLGSARQGFSALIKGTDRGYYVVYRGFTSECLGLVGFTAQICPTMPIEYNR